MNHLLEQPADNIAVPNGGIGSSEPIKQENCSPGIEDDNHQSLENQPVVVKRKRGRPRKSNSTVVEQNQSASAAAAAGVDDPLVLMSNSNEFTMLPPATTTPPQSSAIRSSVVQCDEEDEKIDVEDCSELTDFDVRKQQFVEHGFDGEQKQFPLVRQAISVKEDQQSSLLLYDGNRGCSNNQNAQQTTRACHQKNAVIDDTPPGEEVPKPSAEQEKEGIVIESQMSLSTTLLAAADESHHLDCCEEETAGAESKLIEVEVTGRMVEDMEIGGLKAAEAEVVVAGIPPVEHQEVINDDGDGLQLQPADGVLKYELAETSPTAAVNIYPNVLQIPTISYNEENSMYEISYNQQEAVDPETSMMDELEEAAMAYELEEQHKQQARLSSSSNSNRTPQSQRGSRRSYKPRQTPPRRKTIYSGRFAPNTGPAPHLHKYITYKEFNRQKASLENSPIDPAIRMRERKRLADSFEKQKKTLAARILSEQANQVVDLLVKHPEVMNEKMTQVIMNTTANYFKDHYGKDIFHEAALIRTLQNQYTKREGEPIPKLENPWRPFENAMFADINNVDSQQPVDSSSSSGNENNHETAVPTHPTPNSSAEMSSEYHQSSSSNVHYAASAQKRDFKRNFGHVQNPNHAGN